MEAGQMSTQKERLVDNLGDKTFFLPLSTPARFISFTSKFKTRLRGSRIRL